MNTKLVCYRMNGDIETTTEIRVGTKFKHNGQYVELVSLTRGRTPGKSGKVYIRDHEGKTGEYYDHLFGLSVKLVQQEPGQDRSFAMSEACAILRKQINAFRSDVGQHSRAPSTTPRSSLKRKYNRIRGNFVFLLELNDYEELPDAKIRGEVDRCELIVEGIYENARFAAQMNKRN